MDRKQKTGHDNVMLLAMSTLPLNLKINTYQKEEDGRTLYFKSLAQMEPHTKYVLYMLAQKGERLERIVILESTKARTEKKDGETATTLFEKRIRNYLGASEKVEIHGLDDVSDEQKEREETPCDTQLYKEGFPEIITIDLDEPIYFWRAAKAIRGAEGDRPVHLYMDMQGGDRNAVAQMNAIAELLERQKVKICGRFANDFEPKRREEPHKIRDASREYQTYELISAMDIFARYGWGDKLEEYFRERGRGDTKEKKLVRAIKEASLAISMCSSDRFDSAVRRIEALKKEFENPKTITEMDVVYQDIYENYEMLFKAKYRYVAQIRWCLDRNFLQQALTIFEAKMPCEFVRSGLIYYMTKEKSGKEIFRICEGIYKNPENRERYKMKDLTHYLIKDYCWKKKDKKDNFSDPKKIFSFGLAGKGKDDTISLLEEYKGLSKMRNKINHAAEEKHNPNGFFCYMKKKYPNHSNWKIDKKKSSDEIGKQLRDFLDEWEKLADQVPESLRDRVVDLS
ncbi:MAG TPA: TM1812 family CRISPR-associated protein [Candidatus Mediterraneibacter caccavium]|uniref:TM1812 family CRISPR-associated protein n=1 Tax=Candidatus Mediterraneibacter caccavium TaxID=2838661 RepID=A0A9D1VXH3_9FIRM|nr:TM1812 family CRISPR-associated protein [Candidatus Mediterraneibacter caccavium]